MRCRWFGSEVGRCLTGGLGLLSPLAWVTCRPTLLEVGLTAETQTAVKHRSRLMEPEELSHGAKL
jgi:hypothetical protein